MQRHTMEAAAIAIILLENGSITGPGKEAALFRPVPQVTISDGIPLQARSPNIREQTALRDVLNAAVEAARTVNRSGILRCSVSGKWRCPFEEWLTDTWVVYSGRTTVVSISISKPSMTRPVTPTIVVAGWSEEPWTSSIAAVIVSYCVGCRV